jgi:hypothetical protein
MTGRWILCVSLVLGGACAHTKTTDNGSEKQEKQAEHQPERARTEPKAKPPAGDGKGSELHPGKHDAVPVATAPDVLLKPGAEDKIRERLAAGSYVDRDDKESAGALRQGIRRFQKEHDLPATGVADHETVKRLGLDPNQIFRQATVKD